MKRYFFSVSVLFSLSLHGMLAIKKLAEQRGILAGRIAAQNACQAAKNIATKAQCDSKTSAPFIILSSSVSFGAASYFVYSLGVGAGYSQGFKEGVTRTLSVQTCMDEETNIKE